MVVKQSTRSFNSVVELRNGVIGSEVFVLHYTRSNVNVLLLDEVDPDSYGNKSFCFHYVYLSQRTNEQCSSNIDEPNDRKKILKPVPVNPTVFSNPIQILTM